MPTLPVSHRVTRSWRTAPESVPDARHHTRAALSNWGLPAVIDDAEAIVSELFTNALQASDNDASMISLRLFADHNHLLIMVWDGDPRMPALRNASLDEVNGRGLMIVEALSDACGAAPSVDGGKIVWARMIFNS